METLIEPYPHGNAYVIENDSDAIEQTIFVAWYWDFSEIWDEASSVSTRSGSVDLHGVFVQRNLEDIIFVQIPKDYEFIHHMRRLLLLLWLSDLLAQNPNASAEELKQLLLAETILVDITIEDL